MKTSTVVFVGKKVGGYLAINHQLPKLGDKSHQVLYMNFVNIMFCGTLNLFALNLISLEQKEPNDFL